jgi:hypothetical protein
VYQENLYRHRAANLRPLQMTISAIALVDDYHCGVWNMQVNNRIELFSEHTPPDIEQLFGYQHSKRWVAFFWGNLVNSRASGYCFDGEIFFPLNALAWDTFFGHPLVVAMNHERIKGYAVRRFEFGDMLQSSRDFLLLDRQQRRLHAAKKSCALKHLQMEMLSPNREDSPPYFRFPTNSGESKRRVLLKSKGALQMIADMTAWLDSRKVLLERTGQWPKLN